MTMKIRRHNLQGTLAGLGTAGVGADSRVRTSSGAAKTIGVSKMKPRGWRLLLSVFVSLPLAAGGLGGQQPARETQSGKLQVYVAPFSHLDLFWAGRREETLARGNKIIAKAVAINDQHPDFRFFVESDNFLANFVESHEGTKELADLKRLVQEGRIGLAPNWADIFISLPDGEVQARNLLYGKLYARDIFGANPLAIQPDDIPGFVSQYPQMLREADIPFLVMSRMGPPGKSLFHWSAPNGSRVLVWNEWKGGYGWGVHLGLHDELTPDKIQKVQKELEEAQTVTPGAIYLPWGMDLWSPTSNLVPNLEALTRDLPSDHFLFSTPQRFFEAAEKTSGVPELTGSVPMGWPDIPAGAVNLWQLAAPATNILMTAEEFSAINDALDLAPYPQGDLDLLWKELIESMDHNNGGQGGKAGDDSKREDSRLVMIRGGEIRASMLRNIAERVQIPLANSTPIVVFNGVGWQRDDRVNAHVTLFGDVIPAALGNYRNGLRLLDDEGKPVPFEIEETSHNISEALELIFVASGVPSLGYKTYFLVPADQPESFPPASEAAPKSGKDASEPRSRVDSDVMENRFYRVTVDKATGLVKLFDKQLGRDASNGMAIIAEEERGSDNVQPELDTGVTFRMAVSKTELVENSPVRTVMEISGSVAGIPIVQRLILYGDLKRLDIEDKVDWKWGPPYIRIEQLFPVDPQNSGELVYGVPFGADSFKNVMPGAGPRAGDEINRSAWEHYREIHGWVFAGSPEWGVTLAADHPLVSLAPGMIRAGMIREPDESASLKILRGGRVTTIHYPPAGRYVFRYSLSSGAGDWKAQRSYQLGRDFNSPLMPVEVVDDVSAKSLPAVHSFCSVRGDNLVISALKKSQADGSIILRLYEIAGRNTETPITFLGKETNFRETNLLEQNLGTADERTLRVKPYQIKTLRLDGAR